MTANKLPDREFRFGNRLPPDFAWFCAPKDYQLHDGLVFQTEPNTDFWQRTHYGFQNDNGHALLTPVSGDFAFSAQLVFDYRTMYDQCGLLFRADANNWIKVSLEYEDASISRLGSVVTNSGYSDWATTDINSDVTVMWYRLQRRGQDVLIENSYDGIVWLQMRITHLQADLSEAKVGIYACSPKDSSFECRVPVMHLGLNKWEVPES